LNYISFADEPRVIATARVVRLGRTAAHIEAEARTASGKLVVKALATFAILRRRETAG
jgi:acyl-coenzyme A thioesterase PaaI-like protein